MARTKNCGIDRAWMKPCSRDKKNFFCVLYFQLLPWDLGLIVRTEFPNIKHNIKRECAQKRFFRGLNEYVQEMFYGKVCIKDDVPEKRITLPEPVK